MQQIQALVLLCVFTAVARSNEGNTLHGQLQFEQLLVDRPELRGVLPQDHATVVWIKDAFAGKFSGDRIYWDNRPISPVGGHYGFVETPHRVLVATSDDSDTSPLDKFCILLVELMKASNYEEKRAAADLTRQGQLDLSGFVERCLNNELKNILAVRKLLRDSGVDQITSDKDVYCHWVCDTKDDYELFVKRLSTTEDGRFLIGHYENTFSIILKEVPNAPNAAK